MSQVTMIVPRESEVLEFAKIAAAKGLHFITDGKDTLLSPIVFPGWFEIAVRIKPARLLAA